MDGLYRVDADGVPRDRLDGRSARRHRDPARRGTRNRDELGWDRRSPSSAATASGWIEYAAAGSATPLAPTTGFDAASAGAATGAGADGAASLHAEPLARPDAGGDGSPSNRPRGAPPRSKRAEECALLVLAGAYFVAEPRGLVGRVPRVCQTRANCTVVWPWEEGRLGGVRVDLHGDGDVGAADALADRRRRGGLGGGLRLRARRAQAPRRLLGVLLYADKKARHTSIDWLAAGSVCVAAGSRSAARCTVARPRAALPRRPSRCRTPRAPRNRADLESYPRRSSRRCRPRRRAASERRRRRMAGTVCRRRSRRRRRAPPPRS